MEAEYKSMCPKYEKAVDLLGKRWTALILYCLMDRPRRFTEMREFVAGLSDRLLSERLQELEEAGIVERRVHAVRPVLIEYSLTDKGSDLRKVVEAIAAWAHQWDPSPDPTHSPG